MLPSSTAWRRLRKSMSRPPPGATNHHLLEECRPVPISRYPAGPAMLIGNWCVERKIIDQRGGGMLVFVGHAVITESAFDEYGELQMAGSRLDSRRHYRVSMEDECAQVLFPDGSPFIRLAREPSQHVVHHCGDDTYRGQFFVSDTDRWVEVWSVTGPKKRYRSITHFRRDITDHFDRA